MLSEHTKNLIKHSKNLSGLEQSLIQEIIQLSKRIDNLENKKSK